VSPDAFLLIANWIAIERSAVFGADFPVQLCIWHVKRAWVKNLGEKVKMGGKDSAATRGAHATIFAGLSELVALPRAGGTSRDDFRRQVKAKLVQVKSSFAEHEVFWKYFEKEWVGKLGKPA